MKSPKWRFTLRSLLVAVALFSLIAAAAQWIPPASLALPIPEGARFRVPVTVRMTTAMALRYKTPAPWPKGNQFSLSTPHSTFGRREFGLIVLNMHAENFREVVKRLGLTTVEVQHVGGRYLVVDPHIPPEWLK
jgi:hypothetical protein